ncbi:MAG: hypothetical protein JWR22_1476 [Herminiimonas sp.]|nr:hypothetical protein [Herminiimonas sp.]
MGRSNRVGVAETCIALVRRAPLPRSPKALDALCARAKWLSSTRHSAAQYGYLVLLAWSGEEIVCLRFVGVVTPAFCG